jgi:hypothetical protein
MDTNKRHIVHHDSDPSIGDEVGEAAGGISGVVTGAALGSPGGPIGTVIGGIAGALGGWWAGRAVSEAAKHYTHSDDDFYRHYYESSPKRLGDLSYDDVRPAYQVGHFAGRNPDYAGKSFDAVEADLRHGWENGSAVMGREWDQVRGYARDAYDRSASTVKTASNATQSNRAPLTPDTNEEQY